jgi:hypothetical protein
LALAPSAGNEKDKTMDFEKTCYNCLQDMPAEDAPFETGEQFCELCGQLLPDGTNPPKLGLNEIEIAEALDGETGSVRRNVENTLSAEANDNDAGSINDSDDELDEFGCSYCGVMIDGSAQQIDGEFLCDRCYGELMKELLQEEACDRVDHMTLEDLERFLDRTPVGRSYDEMMVGDVLPNGAVIVAKLSQNKVAGYTGNSNVHPWVIWTVDGAGHTFSGDYSETFAAMATKILTSQGRTVS